MLARAGIVLEICPTSNLLTGALADADEVRARIPRLPRGRRARDRLDRRPRDDAHAPARRVRVPVRHRRDEHRRGARRQRARARGHASWRAAEIGIPPPQHRVRAVPDELRRTPLYERHAELGGRIVPFAGWELPVQYAGVIDEVRAVRTAAGVFDVSHMGQVHVTGDGAHAFLQGVLSNDLDRLTPGHAQYTLLPNEQGGIVDDLIAYRREAGYLLVVNAGNRTADVEHLRARCPADATLERRLRRPRHARAAGARGALAADAAVRGLRPARGRPVHVRRGARRRRRVHDRAHRLHGRARRRADLRRERGRARSGTRCSRPAPSPAAWVRAMPCASRSATRCTATTSRPRRTRSRPASAGSARTARTTSAPT